LTRTKISHRVQRKNKYDNKRERERERGGLFLSYKSKTLKIQKEKTKRVAMKHTITVKKIIRNEGMNLCSVLVGSELRNPMVPVKKIKDSEKQERLLSCLVVYLFSQRYQICIG
jgi:MarR-like DNA-binding transcriptional regulator SgrR of sgrS sRNA